MRPEEEVSTVSHTFLKANSEMFTTYIVIIGSKIRKPDKFFSESSPAAQRTDLSILRISPSGIFFRADLLKALQKFEGL